MRPKFFVMAVNRKTGECFVSPQLEKFDNMDTAKASAMRQAKDNTLCDFVVCGYIGRAFVTEPVNWEQVT